MAEHPEFPQESPAMKYVVDQVSKVEDVRNCSIGYYKSVQQINARIDKIDVELNRLGQATKQLDTILKSGMIPQSIEESANAIIAKTGEQVETYNIELSKKIWFVSEEIKRSNQNFNRIVQQLTERISDIAGKVEKEIPVPTPLYKNGWFWFWVFVIGIVEWWVLKKG
jgi:HAMP domain-containing protein